MDAAYHLNIISIYYVTAKVNRVCRKTIFLKSQFLSNVVRKDKNVSKNYISGNAQVQAQCEISTEILIYSFPRQ